MMPGREDRPWLRRMVLLALAVLARALYLYLIRHNPFFDSPIIDAQTYDEQARDIANGIGSPGEAFWQPPLYPYLLGLVYIVFGRSLFWARVLQTLLSAAVCVLASELAVRRFGARAGWLTGLLLALYGPLFFYTGELLVPPLNLTLDLAVLLALTPPPDRPLTSRRLAVAGLFLGLSAVARPTVLFFLPLLALWLLMPARGGTTRTRFAGVVGLVALTFVPILPVTLHNLRNGGEPVLISSNGGINFYIGNNARYDETLAIRPGLPWSTLIREPEDAGYRTPAQASSYWMTKSWEFFRTRPLEALELQAKKLWLLVQAYEQPRNVDYNFFAQHYLPLLGWLVQFGAVLPLALVGLWLTRKAPGLTAWRLFLVATSISVVAFFVVARYRISLVPVLAVFASITVLELWQAVRKRDLRGFASLAVPVIALAAVIQVDPFHVAHVDEAEGFNLIGKAHSNAGRRREAIEAFKTAVSLAPDLIDAHFNLGRELQLEHRCDEALPHYERTLKSYPRERETLNNLAVCHLSSGRTAQGIALLEQMRAFYPDVPAIYYNLSQAYLKVGRLKEARGVIEAGLKLEPASEFLLRARREVDQRQKALAEESTRSGQAGGDGRKGGLAGIGGQGEGQTGVGGQPAGPASGASPGEGTGDVGQPETGAKSDPGSSPAAIPEALKALNNEAHRLLVQGDPAGARDRLLEVVRQTPGYVTAWSNLGQALYVLQDYPGAQRAFETALRLNPRYWKARLGLALTLAYGFQRIDAARILLQEVAGSAPEPDAGTARRLLAGLPP